MNLAPHQVLSERWRLVDFIGEGAMGEVWRGRHVVLGHQVAIKLMKHDAMHDREMAARFLREARIAAQLRHKNLVRVEDFGTAADGRPYLVMELLHGRSLGSLIAESGRMDRAAVALIAAHVGAACDVAHAASIVHRDLKPDNCYVVSDDDGQPLVKVLDFGVAKVTDSLFITANGIVTSTHALLGTPMYMSPEQARGQPDLDGRSDLWSLAVIVYEMLTGRMPYEAPTISQLLYAVLAGPIPPPSSINPALGPVVDAWMQRALNRDRNQRFQSGRELASALASALGVALPAPSMVPAVPGLPQAPRAYGYTPQGALPAAGTLTHQAPPPPPVGYASAAQSYASAANRDGAITGVKPVVSTVVLPPSDPHANPHASQHAQPTRAQSVTPPTAYSTAVPTPAAAYYTAAEPSGLHRIVPVGASTAGGVARTEAMPAMPMPAAAYTPSPATPPPGVGGAVHHPASVPPAPYFPPVTTAAPPVQHAPMGQHPYVAPQPIAPGEAPRGRSGVLLMLFGVLAGVALTFVIARAVRPRRPAAPPPVVMPAPVPLAPMYNPPPATSSGAGHAGGAHVAPLQPIAPPPPPPPSAPAAPSSAGGGAVAAPRAPSSAGGGAPSGTQRRRNGDEDPPGAGNAGEPARVANPGTHADPPRSGEHGSEYYPDAM